MPAICGDLIWNCSDVSSVRRSHSQHHSLSLPLPPPPFLHTVPAEPNIADLTASRTALTVTWTNSNTTIEVDSYNVTVVDGSNRLVGTSIASSSTSTSPLDVPDKGVTYTVTVTAVNKVGPSTPASRTFYFAGTPLSVHHTEQCHWCGACGVNDFSFVSCTVLLCNAR